MATITTPKTPTGTLASVLGHEVVTSMVQSYKFMQKFTIVGISSILYLRTELNNNAFAKVKVDNVKMTMLDKEHPQGKELLTLLKQALVPLKEGFLRELHVLFVRSSDPDSIVEQHTFKYKSPKNSKGNADNAETATPKQKENALRFQFQKLLKNLGVANQSLSSLPDDVEMRVRLIYDEKAPNNYEVEGFVAASPASISKVRFVEVPPTPIKYGSLKTKWHQCDASVQ